MPLCALCNSNLSFKCEHIYITHFYLFLEKLISISIPIEANYMVY